jgi:acetate kinase
MLILSLNCGSSSVKATLIRVTARERLMDLRVSGIGAENTTLRVDGASTPLEPLNHSQAVTIILETVRKRSDAALTAVAHRVVHGGAQFTRPAVIDSRVEATIESLCPLAPLHNPVALTGIRAARTALPDIPHVAVFDTAFHASLPQHARHYALPHELTQRLGIRRFGFHGTNHAYVGRTVAEHMRARVQDLRIVSCHLGSGSSITAIEYGRSVETSMGMTPLEGLIMGSRAGDIDPGVLLHLLRTGELDVQSLDELLNRESGLKGLTGTPDMRAIEERAAVGDEHCRLAIEAYVHRVRKYIGAYAAVMDGVDAIAFTGGIGENSATIRSRIGHRLRHLGAILDEDANRDVRVDTARPVARISAPESRMQLFVVRADEEMAIALEAAKLLEQQTDLHIPIALSARHLHPSQATVEALFGRGYRLRPRSHLSQPGQFAAEETVTLVGPRGRLERVRVLGPPRAEDQVEISQSDAIHLGIDTPVRISGDLADTPGILVEGPAGSVQLKRGVICARRHIHMHPDDAARFGVRQGDCVSVQIDSHGRDLVFGDVEVRISPDFRLELHLDTDEANAAGVCQGDVGLLQLPQARAPHEPASDRPA